MSLGNSTCPVRDVLGPKCPRSTQSVPSQESRMSLRKWCSMCFYSWIQARTRRPAQLSLQPNVRLGRRARSGGPQADCGTSSADTSPGSPPPPYGSSRPRDPARPTGRSFPARPGDVSRGSHGARRCEPTSFRLVQFSVQADHLHLLVEGPDTRLALGIRGLIIRVARAINRALGRDGSSGTPSLPRPRAHHAPGGPPGLGLRADELSQARAPPALGAGPVLVGALVRRLSRRGPPSATPPARPRPGGGLQDVVGQRRLAPPRADRDLRAACGGE